MRSTSTDARGGSLARALPGVVGVLLLCLGTLSSSATALADGSALNTRAGTPPAVADGAGPAASPVPPAHPPTSPVPTSPPPTSGPADPVAEVPVRPARADDRAPAPAPTRVQVPDLGIDMTVTPVGVTGEGAMEVPSEVEVAGWYRFGPAPGADGSTVIAAHVDSLDQGLGPFASLAAARRDAEVVVTTDDGTEHRYRVADVVQLQRDELPLDDVFARTGEPRLTVITCGGPFDPGSGYRDNVVLTALPVDG